MSKFSSRHNHWDEFQWEKEIRRDERRISSYFRELSSCLDLPGEEDLIYGQLSSRSDLVPSGASPDALRNWLSDHDDDGDFDEDRPRRAPGSTPVDDLDLLASEWNILCASKLRADLELDALGIACAFAKLLARTADFTEPEHECETNLLISLGKRTLTDLNEVSGALEKISKRQKSIEADVSFFLSRLGQIRERLLTQLSKLRSF